MKTRYKIAIVALVALAGSALLGGSFWWWVIGLTVGRTVIEFVFTLALAMGERGRYVQWDGNQEKKEEISY